jgi:uncharacterized protein (TIGR02996 family)
MNLIHEGVPEVIEAREAQWELALAILGHESPTQEKRGDRCYAPRFADDEPNIPSLWVREAACGTLAVVAASPQTAIGVLREMLADGQESVRQEAIFELAELSPAPDVLALLGPMRAQTCRAVRAHFRLVDTGLLSIPSRSEDVLDALLHDLSAWRPVVRRSAAEALGQLGQVTARILCALEDRMTTDEEEVCEAARRAWTGLCERLREGQLGPLPRSEEEAFLLAVWSNPNDAVLPLIYADWLEERGHTERARLVRLEQEHSSLPSGDPRKPSLRESAEKVGYGVCPTWLDLWHRLTQRHRSPQEE